METAVREIPEVVLILAATIIVTTKPRTILIAMTKMTTIRTILVIEEIDFCLAV